MLLYIDFIARVQYNVNQYQKEDVIMAGLIPERETMEVEFKSDLKKLSDSDLVDAVVAFANTNGGDLYLGVEDDGTVSE